MNQVNMMHVVCKKVAWQITFLDMFHIIFVALNYFWFKDFSFMNI